MGDVIDFSQGMAGLRRERTTEGAALAYGKAASVSLPVGDGCPGVELALTEAGEAHFQITVAAADVQAATQDARKALARSFGIDARDEGQMRRLRDQVGEQGWNSYAAAFVQQRFFAKACELVGFVPYLQPRLSDPELPAEGADLSFTADALIKPQVTLSSYDPVEVEFPKKRTVSSQDVSDYLDMMSDRLATFEPDLARDTVGEGDHLVITLQLDGKDADAPGALGAGGPQRLNYEMGSGMMPEEFDHNLLGAKVGQARTFSLSLPTPAPEGDSAGVSFEVLSVKVTVNEIDRKVPARIDDGWVAKNAPEAGTLLGLRAQVREALEAQAEHEWHDAVADAASEELAKRVETMPGEPYVQRVFDMLLGGFAVEMQRQGLDVRAYMSAPGFDQAAFERELTERAQETLRLDIALDALADHENIQVSDDDVRQILALSGAAPGREAEMVRAMGETGEIDQARSDARRARVRAWLVDHAKDTSGPHLQLL